MVQVEGAQATEQTPHHPRPFPSKRHSRVSSTNITNTPTLHNITTTLTGFTELKHARLDEHRNEALHLPNGARAGGDAARQGEGHEAATQVEAVAGEVGVEVAGEGGEVQCRWGVDGR